MDIDNSTITSESDANTVSGLSESSESELPDHLRMQKACATLLLSVKRSTNFPKLP